MSVMQAEQGNGAREESGEHVAVATSASRGEDKSHRVTDTNGATVDEIIAALKREKFTRGRSPNHGDKDKSHRGRSGSSNGSRKGRERFAWNGNCWWCNSDKHKRPDCPIYKKVLADNNGKVPAGVVGAYQKAKKAWVEAQKAAKADKKKDKDQKGHMKPLQVQAGNDTEGE